MTYSIPNNYHYYNNYSIVFLINIINTYKEIIVCLTKIVRVFLKLLREVKTIMGCMLLLLTIVLLSQIIII